MRLKNKGMTIVEILVASLILSIVLLGYIQTQMRSIINTEYSNKANLVSSTSNDFSGLFSNFLINEKDDIDKALVVTEFKSGNWTNDEYSADLDNCKSEGDIDDVDHCDREMMIHFIIKSYKDSLRETMPISKFSFDDCDNTDNLCLVVAWGGDVAVENTCLSVTNNCLVVEIPQ